MRRINLEELFQTSHFRFLSDGNPDGRPAINGKRCLAHKPLEQLLEASIVPEKIRQMGRQGKLDKRSGFCQ
jgi:hypothetical protein